jgi:hypothetical protein
MFEFSAVRGYTIRHLPFVTRASSGPQAMTAHPLSHPSYAEETLHLVCGSDSRPMVYAACPKPHRVNRNHGHDFTMDWSEPAFIGCRLEDRSFRASHPFAIPCNAQKYHRTICPATYHAAGCRASRPRLPKCRTVTPFVPLLPLDS